MVSNGRAESECGKPGEANSRCLQNSMLSNVDAFLFNQEGTTRCFGEKYISSRQVIALIASTE